VFEINSQITKVQEKFDQYRIDALLVSDRLNLRYLFGLDVTAGDGYGLITENDAFYVTDARFVSELNQNFPDLKTVITRDYLSGICQLIEINDVTVLGFESTLSYADYDQLDELVVSDIVPMPGLIDEIREVKDQREIDKIARACRLTVEGLAELEGNLKPGVTEKELANQLLVIMAKKGSTGTSFSTIVATGIRSAFPHGIASDKLVENGDLVTIDCGFYFDGYTSDVTRSFIVGEGTEKQKEILKVVAEAKNATIAANKPGITGAQLDEIGRKIIEKAGFGAQFIHGMGHGIGLDIHEGPNIGGGFEQPLKSGNVITIEPGIYIENFGGVRLEDDVLVTSTGYKILSSLG